MWKPKSITIQITKTSLWSHGDKWDWKAPFRDLEYSKIKAGDDVTLVLEIDERDYVEINKLCDGRFRTELLLEQEK